MNHLSQMILHTEPRQARNRVECIEPPLLCTIQDAAALDRMERHAPVAHAFNTAGSVFAFRAKPNNTNSRPFAAFGRH